MRAWTIQKGTKAPQAAGKIHTDFEKGFIMAEVMGFDDFKELGSEAACRVSLHAVMYYHSHTLFFHRSLGWQHCSSSPVCPLVQPFLHRMALIDKDDRLRHPIFLFLFLVLSCPDVTPSDRIPTL